MDRMVIWQQLNFFSFPLLREVVKIKVITSLGAYQIHRLTWIPPTWDLSLSDSQERERAQCQAHPPCGALVAPARGTRRWRRCTRGTRRWRRCTRSTRRWRILLHLCGNSHLLPAWQEVGIVDEGLTYQWEVAEPAGASPQLDLKRIKANLSSSELNWSPSKPAESSSDGWNCG